MANNEGSEGWAESQSTQISGGYQASELLFLHLNRQLKSLLTNLHIWKNYCMKIMTFKSTVLWHSTETSSTCFSEICKLLSQETEFLKCCSPSTWHQHSFQFSALLAHVTTPTCMCETPTYPSAQVPLQSVQKLLLWVQGGRSPVWRGQSHAHTRTHAWNGTLYGTQSLQIYWAI